MSYDFTFAGRNLSDFYGVTTDRPPREIAEYDFELLDIPGRSGNAYIDNKRYKNVKMKRKIGLIQRPLNAADTIVDDLIEWLAYSQGYQEFEDTDHPGMVTYAVLTNFSEVQTLLRRYHKATLNFSRVPFWYLKSALNYQSVDLTQETPKLTLVNPYLAESKPLISIITTGGSPVAGIRFELWNHGVTKVYTYPGVSGNSEMLIDCDEQVVKVIYSGSTTYYDNEVPEQFGEDATQFKLTLGKDRISSIKIAPRWRCL